MKMSASRFLPSETVERWLEWIARHNNQSYTLTEQTDHHIKDNYEKIRRAFVEGIAQGERSLDEQDR